MEEVRDVVEFDTKVFYINSDYKLETSTFTAPVTGRYQIGTWRIISYVQNGS